MTSSRQESIPSQADRADAAAWEGGRLPPLPRDPRVTIISPSFNLAPYAEWTVRSILEQDYADLELLIVDGASTDGTLETLRKFEDDRRVRLISEPDTQIEALNKGLELATGELVGIMNISDAYAPGAVRAAVAEFNADPRLTLVAGRMQTVEMDGTPVANKEEAATGRAEISLEQVLQVKHYPTTQASFFRRDLALRIGGFAAEFPITVDYSFFLQYMVEAAVLGGRSLSVAPVWAKYLLHPGARSENHPDFTPTAFLVERKLANRWVAERHRSLLTSAQIRLMHRSTCFVELQHRVGVLRQLLPALPALWGYVRFGGGADVMKKAPAYVLPLLAAQIGVRSRKSQ